MSSTEKSIRKSAETVASFRTRLIKSIKLNNKIDELKKEIVEEVSLDNEEIIYSINLDDLNNIEVYLPEQAVKTLTPNVKHPQGTTQSLKQIDIVAVQKFNKANFRCKVETYFHFIFQESSFNIKINYDLEKSDDGQCRIFEDIKEDGISLNFINSSKYLLVTRLIRQVKDSVFTDHYEVDREFEKTNKKQNSI